jgi:hypothetical protein
MAKVEFVLVRTRLTAGRGVRDCVAGFEVFFRYDALCALVYISRLWPFLSFSNFKFHLITLLKAFVALGCDRAVMNKNIGTIPTADEPVAFCVIEPLYCAFHFFPFFRRVFK